MKKHQRVLKIILALGVIFTLTGCQNKKTTSASSSSKSSAVEKKSHSKKTTKKNHHKTTAKSKAKKMKTETAKNTEKPQQPSKGTTVSSNATSTTSTSNQQSSPTQNSSQATTNSQNVNGAKTTVAPATSPQKSNSAGVWSAAKNHELSQFMANWQTKMGQSYQGTYDGKNPDHYGFVFPKSFSNNDFKDHIRINNQPVTLSWWANANSSQAPYRVVAVATYPGKMMDLITYFFINHQGKPEVYYSKTTNGGILYLFPTENVELKQGFVRIFNQ